MALIAPVSLPAGGAVERGKHKIICSDSTGPILAGSSCTLRSSPLIMAPALRSIQLGTPLRVIRAWHCNDGINWLQVEINITELDDSSKNIKRGWINV